MAQTYLGNSRRGRRRSGAPAGIRILPSAPSARPDRTGPAPAAAPSAAVMAPRRAVLSSRMGAGHCPASASAALRRRHQPSAPHRMRDASGPRNRLGPSGSDFFFLLNRAISLFVRRRVPALPPGHAPRRPAAYARLGSTGTRAAACRMRASPPRSPASHPHLRAGRHVPGPRYGTVPFSTRRTFGASCT